LYDEVVGKWFSNITRAFFLNHLQNTDFHYQDLREPDSAKFTFEGKCENVRDVQFNSMNQNDFAAAFENGAIQVSE
jgi:hypothetical protein